MSGGAITYRSPPARSNVQRDEQQTLQPAHASLWLRDTRHAEEGQK